MENDLFSSKDWLNRANSNFIMGTAFSLDSLPESLFLEDLCFELQQCAEKAIKAILVKYDIDFPKTHNISDLLKLLKNKTTIDIPENIIQATKLTRYAVATRYPNWNKISGKEYTLAIQITKDLLEWSKSLIND